MQQIKNLSPWCLRFNILLYPGRLYGSRRCQQRLVFLWTSALGRILTTDNLRKCKVVVMNWCCMCKKDGESIDHLLLHCHLARELFEYGIVITGASLGYAMPCGSSR